MSSSSHANTLYDAELKLWKVRHDRTYELDPERIP